MNKVRLLACMLPAIVSMSSTVVLSTAVVVATSTAVYAEKAPKGQTLRKEIGVPLQEAQNLAKAKKIKEANAKYKEAAAVPNKTAYETYVLGEMGAYIALQGKDYAGAARAYESTLESGQVPAAQKADRVKLVAQLNYAQKN